MSDNRDDTEAHSGAAAGTVVLLEHGVRGVVSGGLFSLDPLFWQEPARPLSEFTRTHGLRALAVISDPHPFSSVPDTRWLLPDGTFFDEPISALTGAFAPEDFSLHLWQIAHRVQYWLSGAVFHVGALADEYHRALLHYSLLSKSFPRTWNTKALLTSNGTLPHWIAQAPVTEIGIWGGTVSGLGRETDPPAGATHSLNALLVNAKRTLDSLVDAANCLPGLRGATLPMGIGAAVRALPERCGVPRALAEALETAWSTWASSLVEYRDYTQHHGELARPFARTHSHVYDSPAGMIGVWVGIPDGPDGEGWPGDNRPAFSLRRDALSYAHESLSALIPLSVQVVSAVLSEVKATKDGEPVA